MKYITMKASNLLKNRIMELSTEQRSLKNQRKTINIVGERTMQPWEATMRHGENRYQLRFLFAAYAVMRGRSFSQVESGYPDDDHPLNYAKDKVQKIIDYYEEAVRTGE